MKKQIKYWGLSLFLAAGLTSCESDEADYQEDATADIGGYARVTDRSISRFDRNSDLNINLFTAEGVTAETVEIVQGGSVIGSANVSGETASFNTSILGDFTFPNADGVDQQTRTNKKKKRTTYSNGQTSEDPFTVNVGKVISLGDNATETTMDSLSSVTLDYEVSTFSADVDDVLLELKKNSDGTYTDSDVDLDTEDGSVMLSETNYTDLDLDVNDTLYYRFTATSGSLNDVTSGQVAIIPKAFTNTNSATISNDLMTNQLNLGSGEVTADGTEGGEIRFLEPTGFEVIEGSNIDFVQVDEDFFDDADVLSARAAYENGTAMESFTNLENGDTFVYRTTRDVEDEDGNSETFNFYGVFQIGNVTVVDGIVVSFDIDYAEGF